MIFKTLIKIHTAPFTVPVSLAKKQKQHRKMVAIRGKRR